MQTSVASLSIKDVIPVNTEVKPPQEAPPVIEVEETTVEETTKKPLSEKMATASAKFYVKMIDGVQTLGLSVWANRKREQKLLHLADGSELDVINIIDRHEAEQLNKEKGTPSVPAEYNKKEAAILTTHLKFEKVLDSLGFTKDEKEEQIEVWAEVAKENGGQIPAHYIAIATTAFAVLERASKVFNL